MALLFYGYFMRVLKKLSDVIGVKFIEDRVMIGRRLHNAARDNSFELSNNGMGRRNFPFMILGIGDVGFPPCLFPIRRAVQRSTCEKDFSASRMLASKAATGPCRGSSNRVAMASYMRR